LNGNAQVVGKRWRKNRISGRCWRARFARCSIGSVKPYSACSALPRRTLLPRPSPFRTRSWKITLSVRVALALLTSNH